MGMRRIWFLIVLLCTYHTITQSIQSTTDEDPIAQSTENFSLEEDKSAEPKEQDLETTTAKHFDDQILETQKPTAEDNQEVETQYVDEVDKADEKEDEKETEEEVVKEDAPKTSEEEKKARQKEYINEALEIILDPATEIHDTKAERLNETIDKLIVENVSLDDFIITMDNLSLNICKESQTALWDYVTDTRNDWKKNEMVHIAAREDEIKMQYWRIFKQKYLDDPRMKTDPELQRRLRIIRERGTNVQMPQSKQREEIDLMQRKWTLASVCPYNNATCTSENRKRMTDILSIFKTSNDSRELLHYWKGFRDATGRQILPIFKDYVERVNKVAVSENFTDAGAMWRYNFEDDNFTATVSQLWSEVKPLYDLIRRYVRRKISSFYKMDPNRDTIPAHLTGNLWAQDWQALYNKVAPYPKEPLPVISDYSNMTAREILDSADSIWTRLGFESARAAYVDSTVGPPPANCLPSSHDLCDGHNYRIRWCGGLGRGSLSRAARLLGHIYYFKQYKDQPVLYRDGPTPAFHDAISEVMSLQASSPVNIPQLLPEPDDLNKSRINYLMWVALEKIPFLSYAYALDKWRWEIFANTSIKDWNKRWWEIREGETGVHAPILRDENDLDPACKYHVVSHVQYITYFISHIMEFQILRSLCEVAGHEGSLHSCSLDSNQLAGERLRAGMSLGASKSWRVVLQAITHETEISTRGILEYFRPLREYLETEEIQIAENNTAIIIGCIVVVVVLLIFVTYLNLKLNVFRKLMGTCKPKRKRSVDIAATHYTGGKVNEAVEINEQGV